MKHYALGVMSGTSLDGIDLALCVFHKKRNYWQFNIKKTKTFRYNKYWIKTLKNLPLKSNKEIEKKDKEYGCLIAKNIISFIKNEEVDFIASHGHTIFHQPENKFTLQIGSGQIIAKKTKKKTISNFRITDVSLNGQGAPLVPIGDLLLFPEYKYCLNLGGFANISIKEKDSIKAFDICPTNIILNKLCEKISLDYDHNGNLAKSGKLIPTIINKLNSLPFYKKEAPKSLGREWVEKNIYPVIMNNSYNTADLLRTFSEHIAIQIGRFLKDKETLLTGGGAHNTFLVNRIQYHSSSKIILPNKKIIDFKEALVFGFLGLLRIKNKINCLKSVTGADKDSCSGIIHNI